MTDFEGLLQLLATANVEFIVIGGVAAFAHGSARVTLDLDVVYNRDARNIGRIVDALAPLAPYPRGIPEGLPFKWDEMTLRNGLNFTLTTQLGAIDLLGEITAGGDYAQLLPHTQSVDVYGTPCLCLDLDELIRVKKATARPKDFEAVAELELIRNRRRQD
jgi:hypothetical protein